MDKALSCEMGKNYY